MKCLLCLFCLAVSSSGCSSISMPSMPSFSWRSGPKADATAEALFDEGMRSFNEKRYVRAIDNFSKLRTDYPFSPQVTQVELKIADAYYLNQQYPEAINAFKEYQSMHPTNENIPFVLLRLGQSHFDQFTSTDRDQKNTEIAKGYFENVVNSYPKSPQAVEAKEKLAKCLEYLAEHEFNVAFFYFKQEKYPAARDRFEEIVRKYKDTPTAVKSLFYLGESYRNEKNVIRAGLAYEALIEHYPQTKFAADAKAQLASLDNEKRDPLALLLMRDRRPTTAPTPEVKEDPALAKLKDINLVAKTEVVHEEPGDEKGLIRRVADKLNPFSSSSSPKKEEKPSETVMETLAKRGQAQKEAQQKEESSKANKLVGQIDDSLKQKGIDPATHETNLKPPAPDLPNTDDLSAPPPKATDTAALLSSVDSSLKRSGKDGTELPPTPEAAEGFKNAAAAQAEIAKRPQPEEPPKDVQSSAILSSIDQKLAAKGVQPGQFDKPPTAEEVKAAAIEQSRANTKLELEPKLSVEKGPLFLSPGNVEIGDKPATLPETNPSDAPSATAEVSSRVLVKGPIRTETNANAKETAAKRPSSSTDDESKGVFDQLRQEVESASKVLNPFRW
ncbi:MAG TPA: outer membrane protein assembly factor BamD [Candidatus Eisenbacteria bacterium]|nr:outer membrane protein assembly factor BamD [Candidatus Eisenbacteria bacterium]